MSTRQIPAANAASSVAAAQATRFAAATPPTAVEEYLARPQQHHTLTEVAIVPPPALQTLEGVIGLVTEQLQVEPQAEIVRLDLRACPSLGLGAVVYALLLCCW